MEKLLIIDDNEDLRQQLKWGLAQEYEIVLATDADEGIAQFHKHRPKVAILDLGLPPHEETSDEGFRCLNELLNFNVSAKVIIMTGNSERDTALRAIQQGAYDFYPKPPVLNELKVIIGRAFHLANIEEQNRSLQRSIEARTTELGGMIGQCPEMQQVFTTIGKVATSDVPVLITGESGTGKELVARAIHEASLRKKGPFIPINCGAIPENLLESELFGHEKGSFTGAHSTVQGKFQYAHKGTLFLDELGELPVNLQVKLLRFLQENTIQRVGGREDIAVDTRTICATNVDIATAIKAGRFREDLYYRVGVITINLIPLRQRGGDVILLANYFLRLFAEEYRKKVKRFTREAMVCLERYEWPGNVRELRNKIQRAVIMCEGVAIEPLDLGFSGVPVGRQSLSTGTVVTLREARDQLEREFIVSAIARQEGNILKAAEELGVSRPTLYDLMKKHGISHNS
jgi:two-component system, NtrC family, response regulator